MYVSVPSGGHCASSHLGEGERVAEETQASCAMAGSMRWFVSW